MRSLFVIALLYLANLNDGWCQALTITASSTTFCNAQSTILTATNIPANSTLQWFRNGTSISGASGSTYVVPQPGSYSLVATLSGPNPSPWSKQTAPAEHLNGYYRSVHFVDPQTGYAAGDFFNFNSGTTVGIVAKTTNGGTTWTSVFTGGGGEMYDVFFINAQTGWIVGRDGFVRYTTDGGTTWGLSQTSLCCPLLAVHFVNAQTGWIVGTTGLFPTQGFVYKTTDGGITWAAQPVGTTKGLQNCFFIDAQTGWAVGAEGTIIKTTNGGSSWTTQRSGTSQDQGLQSVHFIDSQTGWAVGGEEIAVRTTNGGTTWTTSSTFTQNPYGGNLGVQFLDAQTGWVVNSKSGFPGTPGPLYKSADGGITYTTQPVSITTGYYSLNALSFTDPNTGWLVGTNGTILKYSGVITTKQNSNTVNITIASSPTLSASPSTTVCAGSSVTLTASGCAGMVTWSTGATGSSLVVTPPASITYSATCTLNGCAASNPASLSLVVKPMPVGPIIRAFSCNATPTKVWEKKFGGNNFEVLTRVLELTDGNLLWVGTSSSPISGDKTIANKAGDDAWIIKTDPAGNKIWEKIYGGPGGDYPTVSSATSDGGAILVMSSTSGIGGDKTTANYGSGDIWVIRIDVNGNLVRQWSFGGSIEDSPASLIATSDGNYLLSALSYSTGGTGNKDATTAPSRDGGDIWLIKFDPNSTNPTGASIWQRTYGGTLLDAPAEVLETANGDFIVAGYSRSNAGTGNKTSVNFDGAAGLSDYWALRISPDGSQIRWQQSYGGAKTAGDATGQGFGDDILTSLARSNTDGRYVLGGQTKSQGGTGNKTTALRGDVDGWLVEIDGADGSKVTEKTIGGVNRDDFSKIVNLPNGTGYWVTMRVSNTNSQDITATPLGMLDFWVAEIDNNFALSLRWDRRYGGPFDDNLRQITTTSDGGLIINGSQSTDATNNDPFLDYYAIKVATCAGSNSIITCSGQVQTLWASGCVGTVTWSTGATGASIVVTPQQSTTYTATCTMNGCTGPASLPLSVIFSNSALMTIKVGNWNDPAVWSCNRVPTATDSVTLNHAVTVPANYLDNALRITYGTPGRLLYSAGGRLRLGP